jgi:hypothetical protein
MNVLDRLTTAISMLIAPTLMVLFCVLVASDTLEIELFARVRNQEKMLGRLGLTSDLKQGPVSSLANEFFLNLFNLNFLHYVGRGIIFLNQLKCIFFRHR